MLRSLAAACGGEVLAVILTGMGHDGLRRLPASSPPAAACWRRTRRAAWSGACPARWRRPALPRRAAAAGDRGRIAAQGALEDAQHDRTDFEFICRILREALRPRADRRQGLPARDPAVPVAAQAEAARPRRAVRVGCAPMDEAADHASGRGADHQRKRSSSATASRSSILRRCCRRCWRARAASRAHAHLVRRLLDRAGGLFVAMILAEMARAAGRPAGRDRRHRHLERECWRRAKDGMYTQFEVQRGLPIAAAGEVFRAGRRAAGRSAPELRAMVRFSECNLLQDPARSAAST